ncbi:MAG TPA: hypothetical protein VEU74_11905 [Gemmatimonadales bacterium]|nr:hypothetical protein [Gemmatimonadales bacterium]
MARYATEVRVRLLGPNEEFPLLEAGGDGEAAFARWSGEVPNPTPRIRQFGAAGGMSLILEDLAGKSLQPWAATKLLELLRTPA